ncbi:DUF2975 domain-containing protein [Bifidobacterium sp. ESL0732]|uniref:DUF2975 domain-containing protein n=1 Tax=Bifidobacterium sp. ESL0732 TaxID=2983222 RepID=UPI0023FA30DC|nr:DUF2975 domain-containing protein [Bifidobacterium sp. ESL0732]WEV64772.1 DUF2975 domain-containing protein [Bifidobacterium sp. ESL0732]
MYETNKVDAFIMWAAKILEWFNIVASVVLLAGGIFLGAGQPCPDFLKDTKLPNIYGFALDTTFQKVSEHKVALVWYTLEGIAILLIVAYAAKNLSDAFKTIHRPENGEEPTPFRDSIVKNVHRIGWCFISVAIVIASVDFWTGFVTGYTDGMVDTYGIGTHNDYYSDIANSTDGFGYLIIGIFILCITRILRYGEQLQREHDQLI